MLYRFSTLTFFLFLSLFVFSQTSIQQFVNNPALKHASVGLQVTDLKTGITIASYDEQKSLTPASVAKLITTASALEILGGEYRYNTLVGLDKNQPNKILIIGSGDPTLGSEAFGDNKYEFFEQSARALKQQLDSDKEYTIYVVDNLFGYNGVSPEWTWIDMGNYYAAGAYGISIFDNSYKLFFNTTNNISAKIIRTEPEIKQLTFINELTLNNTGRDNGYIYGAPFSFNRAVRGDIPSGRSAFSIKGDIPDPGMLMGEVMAEYLSKSGVKVAEVETARADYLAGKSIIHTVGNILYSHSSPALKEIVRETNVVSNNHYAEHLIRTIGVVKNGSSHDDSLERGIEAIENLWKQKGVVVTSLKLHDGSGLAPQNAFSPSFLNEIIYYMYNKSEESANFISSLPKAGRDGTLRSFMKGTRYEGKIIAKSGSIGGVHCYSGYLLDGDKQYAFTVMVNKFNGTRSQVRSAIEKYLNSL